MPRNASNTLAYTIEVAVLKDPAPDGSDASGERRLETIARFSVDRCHEYTGKGSFTSHSPATIAKGDVVCGGMTLAVDASTRGSRGCGRQLRAAWFSG